MPSFDPYSRNMNNPKPSKPIIVIGSLVVILAVMICVAMKFKASTPPKPTPNPALIQQVSTPQTPVQPQTLTPPVQTIPSQPTATAPVQTADTTPVPPTDQAPDQSTDTAPNQSTDTASDQTQTLDPAPAPELSGMTITPGTVSPGDNFVIEAKLSAPAPPGGVSVALSLGDVAQNPIEIAEGETSGSTNFSAGSGSGTETFTCSYEGISYDTAVTTVDNTADSAPVKDCSETYDDDDDTPCIDAEGDTTTRGQWKSEEQRRMDNAQEEQQRVREETGSGD